MTTDDLPDDTPDELREQIAQARTVREDALKQLGEVRETRQQLVPLWERLGLTPVQDSFGLEFELALVPRRGRA